jgi:arsenate reductase-like glutaredoxin family protein
MGSPRKSITVVPTLVACFCCILCLASRGASSVTPHRTDLQKSIANSRIKTVVNLTAQELRKSYSADLEHVEFDQSQEELGDLLKQVGEKVEALFRNLNDVSAREQVVLRKMNSNGQTAAMARMNFNYLVLVRPDQAGIGFKEERTDRNADSVQLRTALNIVPGNLSNMAGFVVTSGFATLCLYFHPIHQSGSNFRYLGKERGSPRLQVIAFAQKPEVGDFLAAIDGAKGTTPVLVQGLIWVDPRTYEIVRMRTDLLEPDLSDGVMSQTTDIRLAEVRFADSSQVYCLPSRVEVALVFGGALYRNTHSYSDYKLFRVETRIK